MLENMAQIERARKEQEEMQSALAQLRQAQENLGDSAASTLAGRGLAIDDDESGDQEGDSAAGANVDRRRLGESRGASRFGAQSDSSTAAERQPAPNLAEAKSGPILKPQSEIREGESLVTHGQVLPRATRPSVENVQMKAEFASQVEEALSREQYSAQSKEFIRRYFLSLSQGAQTAQQPQTRGGQ
jgi:hypothetical protein